MLDDLDHRLIAALRVDSRSPVAALARELGVNRSTVAARIERLRDSGVIEAFTIQLSNDVDRDAIRGVDGFDRTERRPRRRARDPGLSRG
ncbi:Lrp/AsnC family transcriptional regulator [Micromonospora sp. AP08]|uniref:Lrp/AsnC family transcriptional regulator n=1 Tax=Micromonospora sp. AP08 TaxID=2604467 RepID=UPI001CA3751F|nr:AsnC family transcriptional regulator [Micromonospora sp. AP08]